MTNTLRPTGARPGAVNLDGGAPGVTAGAGRGGVGGAPGAMQTPQMPQGPQTPGNAIRGLLGQTSSLGSYNWKAHSTGLYRDEVLDRMLNNDGTNDPDSMEYFVGRVEYPMMQFINGVFHRNNLFYTEYVKVRDAFPIDPQTGLTVPVQADFIETVKKLPDFVKTVAYNGAPFFGYTLIDILKKEQKDNWIDNDYRYAAQVAARNVLFFEMISWMMHSSKGKEHSMRLPKDLEARLANWDAIRDGVAQVWEVFGATSPYASLEFSRTVTTPTDYRMLYSRTSDYADYIGYVPGGGNTVGDAISPGNEDDIFAMVNRNANARYGITDTPRQAARPTNFERENGMTNWNSTRNDLENLNPQNKGEFNLRKYFHNIGKPNHFFVPESDWKHIQKVFRRHPDMRQEEGLLPGSFRVVIIDLDADNGWFSRIVRSEKLDVPLILSDPEKLLPLIQNPENPNDAFMVQVFPVDEVREENKLSIPVETVKKMEDKIPLVTVKDPIVSRESKELLSTVDVVSEKLTSNMKKQNAVAFNVIAWDAYTCADASEKTRAVQDLPYLFADAVFTADEPAPTPYQAWRHFSKYAQEGIVSNELLGFINSRLTAITNEWLVNVCGYNAAPNKGGMGKLQIDNFIADFEDLNKFLREKDEVTYQWLHVNDKASYLSTKMRMFSVENPHVQKSDNIIEAAKQELDLYVIRQLYVVNVNRNKGPFHEERNVPIYVKRSVWPELFKLVEDGFDDTVGTKPDFDTTDKLIRFGASGNVWLFSHSMVDSNVATLRHVAKDKKLVLLAQD